MFNTNKPDLNDLPTSKQLIHSTFIAAAAAFVLLITVVLPAEYGIDPTRVGQALGLTEMGEIKRQLYEEAEQERHQREGESHSSLSDTIFGFFISTAQAQEKPPLKKDSIEITLAPGEGVEVKLVMEQGDSVSYLWTANGGKLNYDLHGDGKGRSKSYKKGRGLPEDSDSFTAAFDGAHGWFWRNRTRQNVKMTLQVEGKFQEMKRVK